ncbi:MAG: site-specific integrase [Pseudomonadota bacterium]
MQREIGEKWTALPTGAVDQPQVRQAASSEKNPYPAAFASLAIETAMRRGELLSLTRENVDLEEKVAMLPETKNGEAREVPLFEAAREVLRSLPKPWAGPVLPISMSALRGAWERALKENGITDLRHEATSRLFEKGVFDSMEVASITGHKTLAMLKRYTHLRAEDLAKKMG